MRARSIGLGAVIVAGLLAGAPAASAKVELAGGSTTLRLDAGTAGALAGAGVSVKPVRPAKARGRNVTFPITGGKIDPATAAGRINHSGGLRFRAGGKAVALRGLRVHVGAKRAILTGRAGKARLPVAALSLKRAKVTRPGLGTTVRGVRATLTGKAAGALNSTFGTSMFKRGIVLGMVTIKAKPAEAQLAGGYTALELDPGAAAALTSLGVTPGLIAPATAGPDGLRFPITGGKVSVTDYAGSIRHSGGISLTKDPVQVDLSRFTIQVDADPDLTALVGGQRVSILSLDLSGLDARVKGRRITLAGAEASLTATAAGALNQAFGTTAFTEGLVLGTATVKARAR